MLSSAVSGAPARASAAKLALAEAAAANRRTSARFSRLAGGGDVTWSSASTAA
jgi:hypothetical protein